MIRDRFDIAASPAFRLWIVLSLGLLAVTALLALSHPELQIDRMFFLQDDLPVLAAGMILVALLAWPGLRMPAVFGQKLDAVVARRGVLIVLAAAALAGLLAAAGWFTVHARYPLSIDEFWARFDERIIARGRLMAPVDPAWRPFAPALQPMWRLEVPGASFWGSTYLPMNAALRALFSLVGADWATGPVCAAAAVVLVYALAREIWPERRDAAVLAGVLLAASAQVLVTSMSAYAMPAHLALNLAWLWLFRRRSPLAHALAVLVAFIATGLHQWVFHPAFAAPFVLEAWLRRRWAVAVLHTLAYAAIVPFWMGWWSILFSLQGLPASGVSGMARGATRQALALMFSPLGPSLTAQNLLRLLLWQSPLTVPLALAGAPAAWRRPLGPLAAMTAGLASWIVFLTLVAPYQGHGWGFRYLHGYLGGLSLLAAQGWIELTGALEDRRRAWAVLAASLAFGLVVWLPMRLAQVHAFVAPYARAEAAIRGARADVVIVEAAGMLYGDDLVRNDPFLRKRPLVMHRLRLTDEQIRELCATQRVDFFNRLDGARLGVPAAPVQPDARPLGLPPGLPAGCGRHVTEPRA